MPDDLIHLLGVGRTRRGWVDWCKFTCARNPNLALAVLSDVCGRSVALQAIEAWTQPLVPSANQWRGLIPVLPRLERPTRAAAPPANDRTRQVAGFNASLAAIEQMRRFEDDEPAVVVAPEVAP